MDKKREKCKCEDDRRGRKAQERVRESEREADGDEGLERGKAIEKKKR